MSPSATGGGKTPAPRAVIFEFQQIGNSVKVSAIDELTGLEVCIVGPASGMRSELEKVARAKLMKALDRASTNK